jgi:hypothetical protein
VKILPKPPLRRDFADIPDAFVSRHLICGAA